MSKTRKRTKLLRAFYRLPTKDKMVLLTLFASAVAVMVFGIFKLTNMGLVTNLFSFPSSSLIKSGEITDRRLVGYTDLPNMVVYPGTNEAVFVGGEPLAPSEAGQAFQYNEGIVLFVAVGDKTAATKDTISNTFLSILSGKDETGNYDEKVSEKGYMNTLAATYSAGILKSPEGEICNVLVYRRDLDDCSIYLGASVRDDTLLNEASRVLDRAFFTMVEVEENKDAAPVTEEIESSSHSIEEGTTVDVPLGVNRVQRERTQARLDTLTSDNVLEESLVIEPKDAGKDMSIVFTYTNTGQRPSKAVLEKPDGSVTAPVSFNENNSGRIRFKAENVAAGRYKVRVADDIEFGYYMLSVMEDSEYVRLFGEA